MYIPPLDRYSYTATGNCAIYQQRELDELEVQQAFIGILLF